MSKSLDGGLIKRPHSKTQYNEQQMQDFADCANLQTGAKHFLSNFFNIQHPTKGRLLYKPFDFQIELIDSYVNYRFSINLLSRQTGKCCGYQTLVMNKSNNTVMQIGDLIWKDLTLREKAVTKLENWLVALAK
jgi:hypothetical protein